MSDSANFTTPKRTLLPEHEFNHMVENYNSNLKEDDPMHEVELDRNNTPDIASHFTPEDNLAPKRL